MQGLWRERSHEAAGDGDSYALGGPSYPSGCGSLALFCGANLMPGTGATILEQFIKVFSESRQTGALCSRERREWKTFRGPKGTRRRPFRTCEESALASYLRRQRVHAGVHVSPRHSAAQSAARHATSNGVNSRFGEAAPSPIERSHEQRFDRLLAVVTERPGTTAREMCVGDDRRGCAGGGGPGRTSPTKP